MTETKPQARDGRRSAIHTLSIGTTGGQAPAPAAWPVRTGCPRAFRSHGTGSAGAGVTGCWHE